jgi:acyl carrier protein
MVDADRSESERSAAEIERWIAGKVAARVKIDPREVDRGRPLTQLGIDSTEAVVLSGELQEWLGRRIPPTVAWDHPTIEALARHLARPAPTRAPSDDQDRGR